MGDGGSKGALGCAAVGVDVDPLRIIGDIGKGVDAGLINGDPIGQACLRSDAGGLGGDGGFDHDGFP